MQALKASRGGPPSMSRESRLPRPGLLLGTATSCPESHACLGSGSCWGQPRHIQRVTLASARAPVGDSHAMSRESRLPRLGLLLGTATSCPESHACLGSGSCWGQPRHVQRVTLASARQPRPAQSCPITAVLMPLAFRPSHTVPALYLAAGDGCDQFCPCP